MARHYRFGRKLWSSDNVLNAEETATNSDGYHNHLKKLAEDAVDATKHASELNGLLDSLPAGSIAMSTDMQELHKRCVKDQEWLYREFKSALSCLDPWWSGIGLLEQTVLPQIVDALGFVERTIRCYDDKEKEVANEKRYLADRHTNQDRKNQTDMLTASNVKMAGSTSHSPPPCGPIFLPHEPTKTGQIPSRNSIDGDSSSSRVNRDQYPNSDNGGRSHPTKPSAKALGKRRAQPVYTYTHSNPDDLSDVKPAPKPPLNPMASTPRLPSPIPSTELPYMSNNTGSSHLDPVTFSQPIKERKLLRSLLSLLPGGNPPSPPSSPTFELPYELLPDNPDDMKRLVADRGAVLKLRALLMSCYSSKLTNVTELQELHKRALLAQRLLSSQINRAKHEADHSPTQRNEERISSDTIERSSPDDFLDVYARLCVCLARFSVEDECTAEEQQVHDAIERSRTDTRINETDAEEQQVLDVIERSKADTRMDPQQKAALLADDFGDGLVASSSLLKDTVQTKPTPSNIDPPSEEDHEDLQKLYFSKRFQPSVYAYDAMAVAVAREKKEKSGPVAIAREKEEKSGLVAISCERIGSPQGRSRVTGPRPLPNPFKSVPSNTSLSAAAEGIALQPPRHNGPVIVAPEKEEKLGPVSVAPEKEEESGLVAISCERIGSPQGRSRVTGPRPLPNPFKSVPSNTSLSAAAEGIALQPPRHNGPVLVAPEKEEKLGAVSVAPEKEEEAGPVAIAREEEKPGIVAIACEKEGSTVAIACEKEEKSGTVAISCEKGEKSGTVAIVCEKEEKDGKVAVAPEKAEEAGPVAIAREKGQKPGAGKVYLVTALLYVAFTLHICYCTWVTMNYHFG